MNTHRQEEREQIICQLTLEKDLFDPPGIAREDTKLQKKKSMLQRVEVTFNNNLN